MRILCIGDVVGRTGREMLHKFLPELKKTAELVIVNGENASHGRGLTRSSFEELTDAGADVVTLGNHAWGCKDIFALLEHHRQIIRPANFSPRSPGQGYTTVKAKNGVLVGVINLIGRTFMNPADSPFDAADRALKDLKEKTNILIVDFHAEATSEKGAMGWHLNGRVSAVFGTHTHVQTADDCVLPKGTGFISDLGMTGAIYSVLGQDRQTIVDRFVTGIPQRFEVADGRGQLCGCYFEIDENSGQCLSTERVYIKE